MIYFPAQTFDILDVYHVRSQRYSAIAGWIHLTIWFTIKQFSIYRADFELKNFGYLANYYGLSRTSHLKD